MTVPRFAASPARAIAALTPAVSPHPGRLELIYGLRAAIVTVLPLILAELTGKQWLAGLALGGWLGSMADPGGAYEARARWMIAFILGGALCTAIGTLIVGPPWVLAGAMFACAATLAMLRVYGDSGATLATLLTVLVAAAFSATSHTVDAAVRAGSLVAAGGALAALLALVVWPVRRDAPAREALGDSFAQLAAFVREIASTLSTTERGDASDATVRANVDARWHALANRWPGDLRRVIERTRDVIGEARARRLGRSESADVLGELVGAADRMFATLVAISEELASLDGRARDERACAASIVVLERLTDALEHLATALAPPSVTTTMRAPKIAPNDAQVLDEAVVGLWSVVDDEPGDGERAGRDSLVVAHLARAAALLEEAATDVQSAMETITFADSDRRGARDAARDATAIDEHVSNSRMSVADRVWLPLRANLTWESLMFRHAIRLGVATSVSMYAATHIGAGRGIWITTTVVLLLQPYAGVTLARGVFRILGTVGGGVVAALLSVALHRPLAVAAAMFPLTVIAAAARRSHYALFTFFLTPVFVLMAEHSMGDWRLAVTRIVSTLAGAAIALLASRLLWPTWEHERMPGQFAELLDAARTYFRGVAAPQLREAPRVSANEGRRRLGLATNNAESAMQRFVGEPRGQWSDVEALATFLTHVRRLNGSLVALGAAPQGADASGDDAARTARAIDSALQDIAGAVHDGREPAPLPAAIAPSSQTGEHPVVHHVVHHVRAEAAHAAAQAPLARVARAVRRLHRSATRLAQ